MGPPFGRVNDPPSPWSALSHVMVILDVILDVDGPVGVAASVNGNAPVEVIVPGDLRAQ